MESKSTIIPDLPSGPLDSYRKQASFNWKQLKIVLEDQEQLKWKVAILLQIFCTILVREVQQLYLWFNHIYLYFNHGVLKKHNFQDYHLVYLKEILIYFESIDFQIQGCFVSYSWRSGRNWSAIPCSRSPIWA